jgi:hypothetical protein
VAPLPGRRMAYSYEWLYAAYDAVQAEAAAQSAQRARPRNPVQAFLQRNTGGAQGKDGFARMQECRQALEALDGRGWQRSFHQRMFHDNFIRSCSRVFFKTEPAGAFARAHQAVLDLNGWDNLAQEILISTPRRFGKTISVSMFAAALIYSGKAVELSIYSTCKRISQKLLRNVQKFLRLIFEATGQAPFKEIRSNMEEVVLQGPEGASDVRVVNSYPSKVGDAPLAPRDLKVASAHRLVLELAEQAARALEALDQQLLGVVLQRREGARAPLDVGVDGGAYEADGAPEGGAGDAVQGAFGDLGHWGRVRGGSARATEEVASFFFSSSFFLRWVRHVGSAHRLRPAGRCGRGRARCPGCTCRSGAGTGRWRAPGSTRAS